MKKLFTIIFLLHTVITNGQSFAKAMGGTGADIGRSVTVDAAGNTYTSGYFTGTADFNPGVGTFNLTSKGNSDIFVSKLDMAGNFVWAKSMGGGGIDGSIAITLDAFGNVYTAGYYTGTADFDPGPGIFNISSSGGSGDVFISKLDAAGNFVWAKAMGGAGLDVGIGISVDAAGNIYTAGYFNGSADFDPSPAAAFNLVSAGSTDIFISKLDAAGNFVWAKKMGGTVNDAATGISVDASGNVYTTGNYTGTADFNPGAGTFNISGTGGSQDIFISKLDAAGNFVWAKSMGSLVADAGNEIFVDASGNVYTTGNFSSIADFDPGAATFNLTSAGNSDIFVSKLDASGQLIMPATGLNFDGLDDYVDCGNSAGISNLGLTGFTLEAWINLANPSAFNYIFHKNGDYNLYVSGGILYVEYWTNGAGNPAYIRLNSTIAVTANKWTHVAATWDGSSASLYINGVLNNGPQLFSSLSANQNLWIGLLSGTVDEVRVWNRALCQSEIQNNMTAQINPALQTGLMAYYQFNQGTAGANNGGLNSIADISGNANNGSLNNFALFGAISNWAAGAVAGSSPAFNITALAGTAGGAQVCRSAAVYTNTSYVDGGCNLIAAVTVSGTSPVTGTVNACVKIDAAVQTYNGQPYVQRHYDIEPSTNASTATGTVTLYYTQAEFDAYNLARGASPALPVSGNDAAGIANILIGQYHGTGTAPGNYTGGTAVIDPADNNIYWNATYGRWEISFTVTGFSGFYLNTSSTLLPLNLISFTGTQQANGNLLKWRTDNETGVKEFVIEQSSTGSNFRPAGTVTAKNNTLNNYTFTDNTAAGNDVYYRLKIIDNNGRFIHSGIIRLTKNEVNQLAVYPNPISDKATLQVNNKQLTGTVVKITDINGKKVQTFTINNDYEIVDMRKLPPGIYILQTINGTMLKLVKK